MALKGCHGALGLGAQPLAKIILNVNISKRCLHTYVDCSITDNSRVKGITRVFDHRGMAKKKLVHLHNEILFTAVKNGVTSLAGK